MKRYLCSVPEGVCTGAITQTPATWQGSRKTHATRADARRCYIKHLIRLGYQQMEDGTFKSPDGGPRLVISKVSRFGVEFRPGKEGRYMPPIRGHGAVGDGGTN